VNNGKLVIFDLGRVLVRICDGWQHAFERAGLTLPADAIDDATRTHLLDLVKQLEIGQGSVAAFCQDVSNRLGVPCDTVTRMWQGYCLGPYDGAAELLQDLRTAGHTIACLSNTNENHWRTLTDPGDPQGQVLQHLHHPFASHQVGARKPDPAIYAHVEKTTGFAPARIIYFDDAPENLPPAQSRGWTTHLVPRLENPIPAIRLILQDSGIL
jgi:putative hydrolase of the HAD superfamily